MIEFNGCLSEEVRQKEIKAQAKRNRNKFMIFTIVSFFLLVFVAVAKFLISEQKPTFMELISGRVTLFFLLLFVVVLILFIISCVKPQYNKELDKTSAFSVQFDNSKIIYIPAEGFGKRELNYSNLKKILDEGDYYVAVSKENNIRLICQKDLLTKGSLTEFENYFNNIIIKNNNKTSNYEKENTTVENLNEQNKTQEGHDLDEKTFNNDKFKKSKTRNEKSFKFVLIGIILGLVSVALTPIVVKFGINFAVNAITIIFDNLFYGGFVVELFTFILACLMIVLAAVFLFPICIFITPIMALLSLIFPIYQLVAVNRRWFSWVGLAIGLLSVSGCLILAITTLQTI